MLLETVHLGLPESSRDPPTSASSLRGLQMHSTSQAFLLFHKGPGDRTQVSQAASNIIAPLFSTTRHSFSHEKGGKAHIYERSCLFIYLL